MCMRPNQWSLLHRLLFCWLKLCLVSPLCSATTVSPFVQSAVVSVFITGLLAVFLGPYLSLVLPGIGENAGVPRSPLLCLSRYWNKRTKERLAAHGVGQPEGTFSTCS
jgi:hypothetical protein